MPASKLKLNPDKTEFIVFGLKRQMDKLKAYFPSSILGNPLCPAESVWVCGSILIFPCPNIVPAKFCLKTIFTKGDLAETFVLDLSLGLGLNFHITTVVLIVM